MPNRPPPPVNPGDQPRLIARFFARIAARERRPGAALGARVAEAALDRLGAELDRLVLGRTEDDDGE